MAAVGCAVVNEISHPDFLATVRANGEVSGVTRNRGEILHSERCMADSNYVYVTDGSSSTIRWISISNADVTTLAGSPYESGTRDGIGSAARLNHPQNMWGDGVFLYFLEPGNCLVRRLNIATREVTRFAGEANVCDNIGGSIETARFRYPYFLSGDAANLLFAERRRVHVLGGA